MPKQKWTHKSVRRVLVKSKPREDGDGKLLYNSIPIFEQRFSLFFLFDRLHLIGIIN